MIAAGASVLLVTTAQGVLPAAAADVDVTPTAAPPSPAFLALIEAEIETDTGPGTASTGSSGDAFTFAEESGYPFMGDEFLRLTFYSYGFSYPAKACATYSFEYRTDITSNGPDEVDGIGVLAFNAAGDELFDIDEDGPPVGDTVEVSDDAVVSPADLNAGITVNYGAITGVRDVPSGTTMGEGYTWGTPTVTVSEDDSGCPPPTTTTTAPVTTTVPVTTTTQPGTGALTVSNPNPPAGGTITVSGSGFRPSSEVVVSVAGIEVARISTDDVGGFAVSVMVPAGVSGPVEVLATGIDVNGNPKTDRTTVTVQVVQQQATQPTSGPTRSAPTRLAVTG